MLRSTTACTCRRDLQKFPSPRWEFHMFCACACTGRRCQCREWHGDLLIVHHHWQLSSSCACSRSKVPIAPMGKLLTRLPDSRLHNCERFGQQQSVRAAETLKSSHRPDGNIADALAPTHACTTANASVNYSWYVLQRPCKVPIAPMGISHVLRLCLQGGGVYSSGTVSFSSCTITGNTVNGYVRAHVRKFPSPRWEKC